MNKAYYFLNHWKGGIFMANLQIKGMDDDLYMEIKHMAKDEHRSVSQQILYITKLFLAKRKTIEKLKTPAEVLLGLAGSWNDERPAEEIIAEIRAARKSSIRLSEGLDVSA
jgi:hypothetical protein